MPFETRQLCIQSFKISTIDIVAAQARFALRRVVQKLPSRNQRKMADMTTTIAAFSNHVNSPTGAFVWRKVVREPGDILMDAPAHTNNDQLIGMAGGTGTAEEREVARKQWKEWCTRKLSAADTDRKKRRRERVPSESVKANTVEETAAALVSIVHKWRIYSDGGYDGNGAKGVWGKAGYGAAIYLVQDDGSVKESSDLCGPVVTESSSV